MGLALRGDDGEIVARRGLTRVLALEPAYRDAWTLWLGLYRGAGERRDAVAALAVLADAAGAEVTRDSATGGALRLEAAPGRYLFGLDASRSGGLARVRTAVTLPSFVGDSLAVSDLLVTDRAAPAEREAMIAAMPSRLRVARERPLRVYAEVYGLAQADGRSRYDAEYRFEPVGGRAAARRTTVRFRREQPAQGVTIESLAVDPGRLAPGRYRLSLLVRDGTAGRRAASAALEFEVR